jgi:uncharacterized protein YjbI with pentapeptide repeats
MNDSLIEVRKQLHALAEANRQAAKSGDPQELHASQNALAAQLNKFYVRHWELSHLDLHGINLNGYRDPIRCDLAHVSFDGADLTQVDFTSSQFENATFRRAMLVRTVAVKARFQTCFFEETVIDAADFQHARLRNCVMSSVEFRRYPLVTRSDFRGSLVSQVFLDYLLGLDDYLRPSPLPKVRIHPTATDA